MILPNIGSSTDEVVITLQSWCQMNRLITHEAKSDAVILNKQPFIGPLKPIFKVRGRGGGGGDKAIQYKSFSVYLSITINDELSWAKHIHVQSVIQSFSLKSKC